MINQTTTKKTQDDLVKKMGELERLNKIMVERELKMVELKKEIDKLKEKTK
jgi:predicted  nucleic acid-binding Zn-ribbon protein